MNAIPAQLNPVNAAKAQSTASKQQDSAAPDLPFSQVLSSEIAQNKRGSDARNEPDSRANTGVESQATPSTTPIPNESPPPKSTDAGQTPSNPVPADAPPVLPETFLGLAIQPDRLTLDPAGTEGALTDSSSSPGINTPDTEGGKKGRAPLELKADRLAREAASSLKTDSTSSSGKADLRAATPAHSPVAAAAFAGQLAAARQSDSVKPAELPPELMGNPAMRATPLSPLDAPAVMNGVAANRLAPSVGSTAWGQALGDKIVWMAAGAQQTASLTLNPPNLGPLQIVLNISNDQATASFFSAQPEVRQAIENAFPRLREMMNEAGIQLGQATVSADTPQQNDTSGRPAQRIATPFSDLDEAGAASLAAAQVPIRQSGRGLIDTFA